MLGEHLTRLGEKGLNLEVAISSQQEVHKQKVVESLRQIGQDDIAKILNNKQGMNNPM